MKATQRVAKSLSRAIASPQLQRCSTITYDSTSRSVAASRSSITTTTTHYTARPFSLSHSLLSTPTETEPFQAAPEINLDTFQPNYAKETSSEGRGRGRVKRDPLKNVRIVPASPAYFSARPTFTDDFLILQDLLDKYQTLPVVPANEARRVAWHTLESYRTSVDEPIRVSRYHRIIAMLARLNRIHPELMPEEVRTAMNKWERDIQPVGNQPKPIEIDDFGRAVAIGRRKSASCKAWVVLGDGEVLINDKPLHQAFGRVHDRESAMWPLKITSRMDKYNVYAIVGGGGATGQAEAVTLAVAKALIAHEPALKPALRKAGCITRDPRRVERKKPGRLKARKRPTWTKR